MLAYQTSQIDCNLPCFGAGCSAFGRTDAHDSSPTEAAETNCVNPQEALPVVHKEESPNLSEKEALPTHNCQKDGSATTPKRSVSPETSHETKELTPSTHKSSPTHARRPRAPTLQPNCSGSSIRKIHESHRGGFRRSQRLSISSKNALAKESRVAINPVPFKDRTAPPPSPLKKCDNNASSSQQPAASNIQDTPSPSDQQSLSRAQTSTTKPIFASLSSPESSTHIKEKPVNSPSQIINCDCLQSALHMLEELETRNHLMQDYSASDTSQHLAKSLGKCVEILDCQRCVEFSEQMMLMIIITQKITKAFSRLATMFIEQDQSILSSDRAIPLPRLVLIQQLRLERVLNSLKIISRSRGWKTHLAMLDPICQYSKDTMDRLRRINGILNIPNPVSSNDQMILDEE